MHATWLTCLLVVVADLVLSLDGDGAQDRGIVGGAMNGALIYRARCEAWNLRARMFSSGMPAFAVIEGYDIGPDLDPWGTAYRIRVSAVDVIVTSDGPDRIEGTSDDLTIDETTLASLDPRPRMITCHSESPRAEGPPVPEWIDGFRRACSHAIAGSWAFISSGWK